MPWHHVIPRHEWKSRFGNVRGLNAQENLVNLTTEQHAQVHRLLVELNGSQYDNIAALSISKQIGKEEAHRLAASFANTGKKRALGVKRTAEQNAARVEFMKGNQARLGMKNSQKQKDAAGAIWRGKKIPESQVRKMILSKTGVTYSKVTCPRCQKVGGRNAMKRYHFERCRNGVMET
jgi:L-lactate utilization protein LutC